MLAIVAGSIYYSEDRAKRKEYEGLKGEKKAKEKNEAWIRELEARDKEDREEKARRENVRRSRESGNGLGAARSVVEHSEKRETGGVLDAIRDLRRR